jgi:hypothetical protein
MPASNAPIAHSYLPSDFKPKIFTITDDPSWQTDDRNPLRKEGDSALLAEVSYCLVFINFFFPGDALTCVSMHLDWSCLRSCMLLRLFIEAFSVYLVFNLFVGSLLPSQLELFSGYWKLICGLLLGCLVVISLGIWSKHGGH